MELSDSDENLKQRVGCLRRKLESQPAHFPLYVELSDLLFEAGKIPAALNVMEKSMSLGVESGEVKSDSSRAPSCPHPGDGKSLFDRGMEFAEAYLYQDAMECFTHAIDIGYECFEIRYCLAGICKSLKDYSRAEEQCRRSIFLNSAFPPSFLMLASLLYHRGQIPDAIIACQQALLLDPDCSAAYYDLACFHAQLGRKERSLELLELAFSKGFGDFEWACRDPDLRQIRERLEFQLLLRQYRGGT